MIIDCINDPNHPQVYDEPGSDLEIFEVPDGTPITIIVGDDAGTGQALSGDALADWVQRVGGRFATVDELAAADWA